MECNYSYKKEKKIDWRYLSCRYLNNIFSIFGGYG